jgi:hypothetical protein
VRDCKVLELACPKSGYVFRTKPRLGTPSPGLTSLSCNGFAAPFCYAASQITRVESRPGGRSTSPSAASTLGVL